MTYDDALAAAREKVLEAATELVPIPMQATMRPQLREHMAALDAAFKLVAAVGKAQVPCLHKLWCMIGKGCDEDHGSVVWHTKDIPCETCKARAEADTLAAQFREQG